MRGNQAKRNAQTRAECREKWLRGMDSNHDNQLQRLVSYQLDDPGIVQRSGAELAQAHGRQKRAQRQFC
jgi:hypothetical protein